jgi:NAD(P) transhydrogenase subunit beta
MASVDPAHSYTRDLSDVTYILAALFFILSLSGLSKHETATRGNVYGVVAMALSITVTLFDPQFGNGLFFFLALTPGFLLGAFLALRVVMTAMPQLVALLHSFVGVAAVLVGVANAVSDEQDRYNASPLLHKIEIFVGVFIGAVTVTGSLVAAGKLHELLRSAPLVLGGKGWIRHAFNILLVLSCAVLGWRYCDGLDSYSTGLEELLAMIILAFVLGWHLVMAIGGADMPVVVSMLNSYSGWATAASGFMLEVQHMPHCHRRSVVRWVQ